MLTRVEDGNYVAGPLKVDEQELAVRTRSPRNKLGDGLPVATHKLVDAAVAAPAEQVSDSSSVRESKYVPLHDTSPLFVQPFV